MGMHLDQVEPSEQRPCLGDGGFVRAKITEVFGATSPAQNEKLLKDMIWDFRSSLTNKVKLFAFVLL